MEYGVDATAVPRPAWSRRGALTLLAAGALGVAASCSASPKGALMLSITTDMQTPKDVDVVSVFIATDGVPKFDYLGRVLPDGSLTLPSTLALVQPDDPSAQVHVRITAFQQQDGQQNARVLRDVLTTVPSGRTALLRLPLDFLDDGSGQGTLPAQYVPAGPDDAPEGITQFQPSTLASTCDPTGLCNVQGGDCKTMVDGVCGPATVDPATLPTYAPAEVFGDGGILATGAPASCFDAAACFANAAAVTDLDAQACSFPLPQGASAATLNVALVTAQTGACVASGQCYVPLPNDPDEGWTAQGGSVTLAPGVCAKIGSAATLAVSSGPCPAQALSEPVCEPAQAQADAGQPAADAGGCDGNYVVTCLGNDTCGSDSGGSAALTVTGAQATAYVPMNGGQIVPAAGTVDTATCVATIALPGSDGGSCSGVGAGTVTLDLRTGATSGVPCSTSGDGGSCAQGLLSCTVARGTLEGGAPDGAAAELSNGEAVFVGAGFACALVSGGVVQCWGDDTYGELGNGTTISSSTAVAVSGLAGGAAASVSVGEYSACALLAGGSVQCWGDDTEGELGDGTTGASSSVPVAVSGLTGATSVSAGGYFACALASGGAVQCWGDNAYGQLGDGTTTDSPTPVAVSGLTGATSVSAGGNSACALVSGGAVQCWGYDGDGELGDGTTGASSSVPVAVSGLTGATSVSVGQFSACALLAGGSVQCWGDNSAGQLGNGTTTDSPVPVAVSGLTGAASVSVGEYSACAVLSGGAVECWGDDTYGELGTGMTINASVSSGSSVPVAVSGLTGATSVSVGFESACALLAGGTVQCWGSNGSFELGDGTATNSPTPVTVQE